MARLCISFFLTWTAGIVLLCQSSQSYLYTISDGLPMTETSAVYCDSVGYLWVLSNNAVISRFDGRNFTHYPPEVTGHFSTGAQFFYHRGKLWVAHPGTSLSCFVDGQWTYEALPFYKLLTDRRSGDLFAIDTTGAIFQFGVQKQEWIFTGRVPSTSGYRYFQLTQSLDAQEFLLGIGRKHEFCCEQVFTTPSLSHPLWTPRQDLRFAIEYWTDGYVMMNLPQERSVYTTFSVRGSSLVDPAKRFSFCQNMGDYLLLHSTTPVDGEAAWEGRSYQFKPNEYFVELTHFVDPGSGMYATKDRQGHLWYASQSGLRLVYPEHLVMDQNTPHMVSGVHVLQEDANGKIWIGGYTTGLAAFEHGRLVPIPPQAQRFQRFLPGSFRDVRKTIAFWTEDYGLITCDGDTWNYSISRSKNPAGDKGYYFLQLRDGKVAAGMMNRGLCLSDTLHPYTDWDCVDVSKGMLLENVLTICEDRSGRLWAGRQSQGMAVYDPVADTAVTWLRSDDIEKGFGAMSSLIDHNGDLWIGAHDGLYFLREPHHLSILEDNLFEKAVQIPMDEAGRTNVSLMLEHKGYLIFGNKSGYGFIPVDDYHSKGTPTIYFYPTERFLKSCDQNTILVDSKGYLWLGQDFGVTRIDLDKLEFDTLPVEIVIDSVMVGGERLKGDASGGRRDYQQLNSKVSLPVFKRHMEIYLSPSFTGLLNDNVGFQYRLLHEKIQDTTWSQYSSERRIDLNYLPPGRNRVEIRAIKNNQVADLRIMEFHVPLALSENPWFWACLIGGLSLAGIALSRHMYRQQLNMKKVQLALKNKELELSEEQREKEQLQIRAITSSLNPHFLNNSLQWLQSRVLKDPEAVRMIDRLAKNIQTVFVKSSDGKAFHPLKNELELVKNYLLIQQLRFGPLKDLRIPAELPGRIGEIQIPLMQLQIHVENAVEHGLRVRPDSGYLEIDIKENETYLEINITDDGIGRPKAMKLNKHGTQQGTRMLASLHAIFNKHNAMTITSSYIDTPFVDPGTNERYGTTVQIRIPKEYTYELPNNEIFRH